MKQNDLQSWARVAQAANSGSSQTTQNESKQPHFLRVLGLPGVREFEDMLLLHGDDVARISYAADKLSLQLFGITVKDTQAGDEVDDDEWESHEDQFETGDHLTDDETMAVLARLGLDFSNERGLPLRCTKIMSRTAEAAAKGICGKLPEREVVGVLMWEDALKRERDEYLAKKRRGQ